MGAYLSQPKCDKDSADDANEYLEVGSSSMQGWRTNQEDAHNAILDYDTQAAFFAVFDGHGGAEVAAYCAVELPQFLKRLTAYTQGDFATALKEAFMGFDASLLEPHVAEILRELAEEANSKNQTDDEVEDLVELHEESNLPLTEVLQKYKGCMGGGAAAPAAPSMPSVAKLKDGAADGKPQSPYLRGRRAAAVLAEAVNKAVMNPEAKPEGSSTSAAARAAISSNEAGPSSSKSVPLKMDTEEDSTVSSSSSSSTAKSAASANNTKAEVASAADKANEEPATLNGSGGGGSAAAPAPAAETASSDTPSAAAATTASKELVSPDSSLAHIKETEQNGRVTSSASPKVKLDVSTSEATVSGSSDTANVVRIQNGTVGSTSSSAAGSSSAAATAGGAGGSISSTSKASPAAANDDDEEDADYELDNSEAEEDTINDEDSSEEEADSDDEAVVRNQLAFAGYGDVDDEVDTSDEDVDDDDDEKLGPRSIFSMSDDVAGKDSGCTAVVALLKGRDLYVANAGDSRCVVCRSGHAIEMSLDHKPEDEEETLRILKAGGRVTGDGRVNGGLNLSRAIGDHGYKMNAALPPEEQMITALPDIKKLIVQPEDEFMVLACDGIWNYMSSEEVVQFVRERINVEGKKLSQICEELFDNCLAPNTTGDGTGCDNMTAVIVRFQPKLLECETKIEPSEAEDLPAKKAQRDSTSQMDSSAEADDEGARKSQKRPFDDMNSNEVEQSVATDPATKRLKTDEEQLTAAANAVAASISCSSSGADAASSNKTAASSSSEPSASVTAPTTTATATTSSPASESVATTSEEKECTTSGATP